LKIPAIALALRPDQRYSHVVAKKPLVFPTPKAPDPPVPGATLGSRVIVGIGGERFAIDFYRKITPLNPEPGSVVSVDRGKGKKRSFSDK
jgi:hypothetical protein